MCFCIWCCWFVGVGSAFVCCLLVIMLVSLLSRFVMLEMWIRDGCDSYCIEEIPLPTTLLMRVSFDTKRKSCCGSYFIFWNES